MTLVSHRKMLMYLTLLDLNLPSASKHPKDPPRKANYITVEASGKLWLNKQSLDLATMLQTLVNLRTDDPDLSVIVRGDAHTKYDRIVGVLGVSMPKAVMPARKLLETHTSTADALAHFAGLPT